MERRSSLLLAAMAVGAVLAMAGALILPKADANHERAEKVVREAGVSPGVTPGPHR